MGVYNTIIFRLFHDGHYTYLLHMHELYIFYNNFIIYLILCHLDFMLDILYYFCALTKNGINNNFQQIFEFPSNVQYMNWILAFDRRRAYPIGIYYRGSKVYGIKRPNLDWHKKRSFSIFYFLNRTNF